MRLLICGILCLVMMAQNNSEAYLDQLMSMPSIAGAEVSPDGRFVAWTWYHTGPAADVYVAPTDGSAKPTRLTNSTNDTTLTGWAPDSKSVLVERDHDGDERYQLFQVQVDTPNDLKAVTKPAPPYFPNFGALHPNGHWLVFAANYDFEAKKEIDLISIVRQDIQTGEVKTLARTQKSTWVHPTLNKQGTRVLYQRADLDPNGRQIWIVDIDGTNDREAINAGATKNVDACWMPDGERILFVAEAKDHRKVGLYNCNDKSIKWLIDDATRNVESASAPEGTDKVVIGEVNNAREIYTLLDPATRTEQPVRDRDAITEPLAPAAAGGFVSMRYSATLPGEIVVDRKTVAEPWSHTAIKSSQLIPAENYFWKSSDGIQIHGFLYRCGIAARGTIILVHGGPTSHDQDAFDASTQYFLSEHFNVFQPNYRGSTGYGLKFQDAIKVEGWGGKEQEDIRTGIESLIREGIAHPGKVGITGTSYGGYSSWFAITHFPTNIVAASAPICGMTDLIVDYQTTRPDLRRYSEQMMGGTPETAKERYWERSPIHFVKNIKGKLLIVQGGQDPNVTPENVTAVEAELKKHAIPYELMVFPDEGHGISKPANERKLLIRLADFFTSAFAS